MKITKILLVTTFAFFLFSTCKKDESTNDTSNDALLFKSFQTMVLASDKMIEISDSLNISPREAMYHTMLFIKTQEGVEQVIYEDSAYLRIITSGGYSSTVYLDAIGSDSLSLFRGGQGETSGLLKYESSGGGNCSNKIENKKVLLFAAFHDDFYPPNEYQTRVVDVIDNSDVDVEVTTLRNLECTLDKVRTFNQYGFVILDTHGENNGIYIGTRFKVLRHVLPTNADAYKDFVIAKIGAENYSLLATKDLELTIAEKYIYPSSLPLQYRQYYDFLLKLTSKGVRELVPDLSGTILFANCCYSGWKASTYAPPGRDYTNTYDPIQPAWMSKSPIALYAYEAANSGVSYKAWNNFCKGNEDTLIRSFFYDGDSTGMAHLLDGSTISELPYSDAMNFWDNGPLQFNQYASPQWCYGSCGDTILDKRDQQKYPTVCIGDQVWMAKNLNWAGAGKCYENSPAFCNIYGRLYTWAEATGNSSSGTIPSGIKGVCPTGWHIPSEPEWMELINNLGGKIVAGGKLKSTTGWNPPNTAATNSSGFSALPSGYMDSTTVNGNLQFQGEGYDAMWWTSTLDNADQTQAHWHHVYYKWEAITVGSFFTRRWSSVRCVKD